MSDDATRMTNEEQGDDVEAHRKHLAATDEIQSTDDEVEAHRHHVAANDDGQSTEGDDDFEAHRARANHPKKA